MAEAGNPLVTFALFAYNQQRFIAEAVESALAQDYSPLEIIISDDCSTDATFSIIQRMVANYSGPHLVKTNRNPTNLGIARHVNAVMDMVATDFVVVGAGDDISATRRTSSLVRAWCSSGRKALSIHSSALEIDEGGALTGQLRKGCSSAELNDIAAHASRNLGVLGATHGWDMSLIRGFDPILPDVVNEDVILPARAALLGRTHFIDEPLVRYRVGVGVSHEVVRRRSAGSFELSPALLKRAYYSFLQKYRDYRLMGVHTAYREHFSRARAECLFPLWLRLGHSSPRMVRFFLVRCGWNFMLWEILKAKFPAGVAVKQRVQFWVVAQSRRSLTRRGGIK